MKDFIRKHPHTIINTAGIILTVLAAIPGRASFFGFLFCMLIVRYPFLLLLPIISCFIAYMAVKADKKALAVVFSVLFGSTGGFIGDHSDKRIKIIFHIHMWLVAAIAFSFGSGLYYAGSHY